MTGQLTLQLAARARESDAAARTSGQPGTVYMLHFIAPYRHAQHYVGKPESSRILTGLTQASASEFVTSSGPPGGAWVAGCAGAPASQQAKFAPAFTLAALVTLTDRRELEHGVPVRLGDEVLHRGVLGRLEIPSRGKSDADVSLEDGPLRPGGLP